MKKIVILILAIVMMASMCACSNNADPDAIIENPEWDESAKENSLYACMGSELEINGIVVKAAALYAYGGDSDEVSGKHLNASFYVDRINGSIYVYVEDGHGEYATAGMVKTDYTYSGDLIVNGVKIPWLVDPADRKN